MKPIIVLAVLAVAGITLGTGFLNNDIELWIQQFGVGSGDIQTPTDHVTVDFNIAQVKDPATGFFKNNVDKCILTPEDTIGVPAAGGGDPFMVPTKLSSLTCKLTGKDQATWDPNGLVLTEGKVCAFVFAAGQPVMIPMGFTCDENDLVNGATPVELVGASESEPVKQVGDVIVVAHGNTYSAGD